jgi:hypothetical protein
MAGFAGLVALLGVYSEALYSIKDGNPAFPQALLEKSGSKLQLETNVTCIEKTADQTFHVHDETNSAAFDAVIVASPLETAKIQFDGTENQNIPKREYQQIHIRLMKGVVTPQFFNMDAAAKLPSIILTSKQADPITRFSVNKLNHNESMVTITSTKPVDDSLVTELFKNGKTVHDHTWTAAYPVFKPTQNLPNTYLDNGVFYLNAIESSASSMESSTFAALNSIRTIKQQLTKTPNWR